MARRARRPLVAGNWKMNGTRSSAREVKALGRLVAKSQTKPSCEIMICPPATLVHHIRDAARGTPVRVGGQDCHFAQGGAHTGDISADMLKDAGARAVIVGHSERRSDHDESDAVVCAKAEAVHACGLTAIVCVGETETQRDDGATLRIVGAQLKGSLPASATAKNTVIAYEPVWAIGTGRTPTNEDVAKVHQHLRRRLVALLGEAEGEGTRVLYGGSVKPGNAVELMGIDNVDGALVGGASLTAKDFFGIIAAYIR